MEEEKIDFRLEFSLGKYSEGERMHICSGHDPKGELYLSIGMAKKQYQKSYERIQFPARKLFDFFKSLEA